MICKYCGQEIGNGVNVCPCCGAHLDNKQAEKQVVSSETTEKIKSAANSLLDSNVKGKNKLVAVLLAFFLGWCGGHQFYLGHSGNGILCILFCWTGIPGLIGIIQGIIMLIESDYQFGKRIN